jgi:hypothetical protein
MNENGKKRQGQHLTLRPGLISLFVFVKRDRFRNQSGVMKTPSLPVSLFSPCHSQKKSITKYSLYPFSLSCLQAGD